MKKLHLLIVIGIFLSISTPAIADKMKYISSTKMGSIDYYIDTSSINIKSYPTYVFVGGKYIKHNTKKNEIISSTYFTCSFNCEPTNKSTVEINIEKKTKYNKNNEKVQEYNPQKYMYGENTPFGKIRKVTCGVAKKLVSSK